MTNEQRASQAWAVLVFAAQNQKIISYTTLERLTGLPARSWGRVLGLVAGYCKRNKLPLLPAIVVKLDKSGGVPGHNYPGYLEAGEFEAFKEQSRVFAFDWATLKAPLTREFKRT